MYTRFDRGCSVDNYFSFKLNGNMLISFTFSVWFSWFSIVNTFFDNIVFVCDDSPEVLDVRWRSRASGARAFALGSLRWRRWPARRSGREARCSFDSYTRHWGPSRSKRSKLFIKTLLKWIPLKICVQFSFGILDSLSVGSPQSNTFCFICQN